MSEEVQPRAFHTRPMRFVKMEGDCIVCLSHARHADGYLYKRWGWGKASTREKFHRFIYRAHNGEQSLPKGWEVDHTCWNKACCNPRHLRALSRADHQDYTNRTKGDERREAARCAWLAYDRKLTSVRLGPMFGVAQQTASNWISAWKKEEALMGG